MTAPVVWATPEDLDEWLEGSQYDVDEADAPRQLRRASEVIDDWTAGSYSPGPDGKPLHDVLLDPLRDATCAQVEAWCEIGEENDIARYEPDAVLAPRARRILNRPIVVDTDDRGVETVVVLLNEHVGPGQPIGINLV